MIHYPKHVRIIKQTRKPRKNNFNLLLCEGTDKKIDQIGE